MKMVLKIAFCCCLTAAAGMAQRGGGGGHGGGMGGGGMRGGGGMGGGGMRGGGWGGGGMGGGGMRGGGWGGGGMGGGGWRGGGIGGGGWRGGGWRGGNWGWRGNGWRGNGWGWRGGNWGWGWPGWGWGLGWGGGWGWGGGAWPASSFVWDSSSYWPGYSDTSYGGPSYASGGFPQQQPGNNITVIYPPQSPQVTVNPVVREYDQFGQQIGGPVPSAPANTAVGNAGSTLFLIALHDHSIRAAVAYWVQGNTLHFVTTEHETKMVPLDSVDRDLSRQLNAERRVQFSLPSR